MAQDQRRQHGVLLTMSPEIAARHKPEEEELAKKTAELARLELELVGVTLAIYYGPRQMLETWDRYVDRFRDAAILDIVRNRLFHRPAGYSVSNFVPRPPQERERVPLA